jgi:flavin-binding protein dodecin
MSVYKVIELVGTSKESWEDAANKAILTANKSLRELRVAEVTKMDVRLDDGDVIEYRVRVNVSFKYED